MQLILPGSSTVSTPLGYGCSQLMGGITHRESLALLETAFDAGIRHFDTAPSYGYGHAERVLGEALRPQRTQVTITTKFGLKPPRRQSLLGVARKLALPVVKRVPGLKSRLSRAAGGLVGRARFAPGELRASIDASLAALATDYIDILLLHEATVADLSDELLTELQRNVALGKIRSFGIGSEATAAVAVHRSDPRFCPVIQFEWSVLSREPPGRRGSFVITHRALSESLVRLRAWLAARPETVRRWSKELDRDIADAGVLSRLMLAAARQANPGGITLFSSRNPANIRMNARLILEDGGGAESTAFAALVASEVRSAASPGESRAAERLTETAGS